MADPRGGSANRLELSCVPEAPLASQLSASAISEYLSQCSVSIHCVGPRRGMTPEDETLPIDQLQLIRARMAQVDRIVCQTGEPHAAMAELLKAATSQRSEELIR